MGANISLYTAAYIFESMKKKDTSYRLWKTALIYVNILSWNTKQGMGDWGQDPDTCRPNTTANYRC